MSRRTIELPTVESVKKEVRALGNEAADYADRTLVRPARRLARETRRAVSAGADHTEELILTQRNRASDWIVAHPFAAVGLALAAGLVLNSLMRSRR